MLSRRTLLTAIAALPVAVAGIPAALARSGPVTLGSPGPVVVTIPSFVFSTEVTPM